MIDRLMVVIRNRLYTNAFVFLTLLGTNLGITPAFSASPEIRTNKEVYAPRERITVYFSNAPGNQADRIVFVTRSDNVTKRQMFLQRRTDGSNILPGLLAGEYEVRLYSAGGEGMLASFPFTVGVLANKSDPILNNDVKVGLGESSSPLANQAFPNVYGVDPNPKPGSSTVISEGFVDKRTSLPEPGIEGSWLGYVTCNIKNLRKRENTTNYQAFLDISGRDQLDAKFFILWQSIDGNALQLSGRYDEGSGHVSLKAKEWIYKPRSASKPIDLVATVDSTGLRLNGKILNVPNCSEFQAFKFLRDERNENEKGILTAWKKYKRAAAYEKTCIPYLKWTVGGKQIKTQGKEIPSQVMNSNSFNKIMGKSYDQWNVEDGEANYDFWNECLRKLSGSLDVTISTLVDKARRIKALGSFLTEGMPTERKGNWREIRDHYGYLSNYALFISLRYARLYTDLQLKETKNMSDTKENIQAIDFQISRAKSGNGVLEALPEDDQQELVESLIARKEQMSGAVINQIFSQFDVSAYSNNLEGLKKAKEDLKTTETKVSNYATGPQLSGLKKKLDESVAPLSKSVANQYIASMPEISGTVSGFIEGKKQKKDIKNNVAIYLLKLDRSRLIQTYKERNVRAVNQLSSTFPSWLNENISPDKKGVATLSRLSNSMFDSTIEELDGKKLSAPFNKLRVALIARNKKLKREICDLPKGFQELQDILCTKSV